MHVVAIVIVSIFNENNTRILKMGFLDLIIKLAPVIHLHPAVNCQNSAPTECPNKERTSTNNNKWQTDSSCSKCCLIFFYYSSLAKQSFGNFSFSHSNHYPFFWLTTTPGTGCYVTVLHNSPNFLSHSIFARTVTLNCIQHEEHLNAARKWQFVFWDPRFVKVAPFWTFFIPRSPQCLLTLHNRQLLQVTLSGSHLIEWPWNFNTLYAVSVYQVSGKYNITKPHNDQTRVLGLGSKLQSFGNAGPTCVDYFKMRSSRGSSLNIIANFL